MRAVERGAMANSDHDIVQTMQLARVVMNTAGRHDAKSHGACDINECSRQRQITANAIALDLDKKSLGAEYRLASLGEFSGCAQSIVFQRPGQQAIPARARQDDESVMPFFKRRVRESRIEPLRAEVRGGE